MISPPVVPNEVLDALRSLRRPVLVTHVVPDADALGSMFALTAACRSAECRPRASVPDGSISTRLGFMAGLAALKTATPDDFADADGFIVLDTAKKGRCNVGAALKETDWSAGRVIMNIDHHEGSTRFGDVNWVVAEAGSTCELVYYLLRAWDLEITPAVASLLYAGIQTDTLGFSLPSTRAATLHAAAMLVACGADVGMLGDRLCRSLRKSEFDLVRVIYANTKVLAGGDLAYSSASYTEIHDAGCRAADIDDQINVPRSLEGARLAMLFTEGKRGKTRLNFRGSHEVTVIELAAAFKGGGHSQAAGAVLDCGLEEAIERVVPRALEHLEKFPR